MTVDDLLFLHRLKNFVVLDWRWTKTDLLLSHVVLINTLCSELTFTRVNLRGQGGDGTEAVGTGTVVMGTGWGWDRGCGDRVGISTVVHGDGRGWGSVSVTVQTSTVRPSLCA